MGLASRAASSRMRGTESQRSGRLGHPDRGATQILERVVLDVDAAQAVVLDVLGGDVAVADVLGAKRVVLDVAGVDCVLARQRDRGAGERREQRDECDRHGRRRPTASWKLAHEYTSDWA